MTKCAGACVLMILFFALELSADKPNICTCAVMSSPDPTSPPELEHPLDIKKLNITCDEEGQETCKKLCMALAEATSSGPAGHTRFCKAIKKTIKISPSLFTKVCDQQFVFSGKTYETPVCCVNGVSEPCLPS